MGSEQKPLRHPVLVPDRGPGAWRSPHIGAVAAPIGCCLSNHLPRATLRPWQYWQRVQNCGLAENLVREEAIAGCRI
jgi:hypothetical protein